ncbi:MAG TPA: amidohydrolase family protein [Acidobacteriaceae bacterium]
MPTEDKFVAMVSAKADVDLPLSDFLPVSELRIPAHDLQKPRFPAIDFHNHLDSMEPAEVLRIMDTCGVEKIVNITMRTGDEALSIMDKFHAADRSRFYSIGWMDWTDLHQDGFVALTLERLEQMAEHGASGIKFWKDLGLTLTDKSGKLLRIDDERLAPIFERAADLGLFVMFHTADPAAFFRPIDRYNERYEELAAHPDWAFSGIPVEKWELLNQRNTVFGRHPKTTFVGAHVGESGEDLAFVRDMLDNYPNVHIDISARTPELGRQPYTARKLFMEFPDRILFGTDLLPEISMYCLHYRFLETADEYFEYPSHASRQGRWNIYGVFLPDDVLLKLYRENALKLLKR